MVISQSCSQNDEDCLQWYFLQTFLKLLLKTNPYILLNSQVKTTAFPFFFSKCYQRVLKFTQK